MVMAFESNKGVNKLAKVLSSRMQKHGENPLVLDFGSILENMSLLTNTFPKEIPSGQYTVCRQLTLGATDDILADTQDTDQVKSGSSDGAHQHHVAIPEKMRSIKPGDRVLVAWVQDEAVVVDIVKMA